MKKPTCILSIVAFICLSFIQAGPTTWTIDVAHSGLRFAITSLSISEIEGTFKFREATITAPKEDFTDAALYLVIDANTLDTDNDDRDAHLKGPDFFDTSKYPEISFRSTSFKKTGDKKYAVTGDLTMHGITKPVTLETTANFGIHPQSNKPVAGFRVSGTIRRTDFGISPATPSAMLSDEVIIIANAQFSKN